MSKEYIYNVEIEFSIGDYDFSIGGIIEDKDDLKVFKNMTPLNQLKHLLEDGNDVTLTSDIDTTAANGINTIIEKEEI